MAYKPQGAHRINALILVDTETWANRRIASKAIKGRLSPNGDLIAAWNSKHEIHLLHGDGTPVKKVGKRGAVPHFSRDGRWVAYEKLADESIDGADQSLFEFADGIAVYDVHTDTDTLVTLGGGDDFAPVGFSLDTTKLFFNSARPYRDDLPH
jgi:tricorn protease-like protein